jgi:hypothetical protein
MTPSPLSHDRTSASRTAAARRWDDAERFIVGLQQASRRTEIELAVFFQNWVGQLLKLLAASDGRIEVRPVSEGAAPSTERATWRAAGPGDAWLQTLEMSEPIDVDLALCLVIRFDKAVAPPRMPDQEELVAAVLDIFVTVYLRHQHGRLRRRISDLQLRDQWLEIAEKGETVSESAARIGREIAAQTATDRVAILRFTPAGWRLIATSTQSSVDRRSRQVRVMESLAGACASEGVGIDWADVDPDGTSALSDPVAEALRTYSDEVPIGRLRLVPIDDAGSNESASGSAGEHSSRRTIAVLLLERFDGRGEAGAAPRQTSESRDPIDFPDAIRQAAEAAVLATIRRDDSAWSAAKFATAARSRLARNLWLKLGIAGGLALVAIIPVELRIHAQGRLVPVVQNRLFAPTEGIVSDVMVDDGQAVSQGDPLVTLRSPTLDLARQQVVGDLATARVRLASLIASRTRSGGQGRVPDSDLGELSASEESVKSQIEGLQRQLELLDQQLATLRITSPTTGVAVRWDLNRQLKNRPVAAGQFLLDVIAPESGWAVELDVSDADIGYLLDRRAGAGPTASFHFRSHPERKLTGRVSAIDRVAQVNSRGESFVRVVVPFGGSGGGASDGGGDADPVSAAVSATVLDGKLDGTRVNSGVLATIDCGKRPLISVYSRGLVRWARVNLGW